MFFSKRLMISTCKFVHISRLYTINSTFSSVAWSRSRHPPCRHLFSILPKQQHVIKQLSPGSFSLYLHKSSCSLLNNNNHRHFSINIVNKMAAEMTTVKTFERLPKSVVPVHYEIRIKPDLVKLLFEGDETISIKVIFIVDNYFEFFFMCNLTC